MTVASASEDFLETYGVSPVMGRAFQIDDTRQGAPRVALLGHAFWRTAFGGDPRVLGRVIRIQNEPVTIVGVLPSGFYDVSAIWEAEAVLHADGEHERVGRSRRRSVTARCDARTGRTTPAPIDRCLDNVWTAPMPTQPALRSLYEDETSGYGATLRILTAAVVLILVIACVNVTSLLLVRGATRETELAVRPHRRGTRASDTSTADGEPASGRRRQWTGPALRVAFT